jgi:hypothetical protein
MTDVVSQQNLVLIANTNFNVALLELRQVNERLVTSICEEMIYNIKELEIVEQSLKNVRKKEEKKKSPNHLKKKNMKRKNS